MVCSVFALLRTPKFISDISVVTLYVPKLPDCPVFFNKLLKVIQLADKYYGLRMLVGMVKIFEVFGMPINAPNHISNYKFSVQHTSAALQAGVRHGHC